ncbi:MAG: hypothetical protein HY711_08025, partial [Candidatus Melainabacteria bacterium]|nr:hypothetical protein [Candidatus Melainabacteria bacterium]
WVVFSFLIIFNIANIHNDPPYWRAFFFLMIDAGIVLQLWLIWKKTDLPDRAKSAGAAMIMSTLGALQALTAIVYYFMARTEMFLSPLTQSFAYWLLKPFVGTSGNRAESLVKEALTANPDYWNYKVLLKTSHEIPGKDILYKVQEVCLQSTPLDSLFQLIPTFVPNITYNGLLDFMVSNRWCFDYVTFCDCINGLVKPYPLDVPCLDWTWMIGGVLAMLLSFWTHQWCRKAASKVNAPPAKPTAMSVSSGG